MLIQIMDSVEDIITLLCFGERFARIYLEYLTKGDSSGEERLLNS